MDSFAPTSIFSENVTKVNKLEANKLSNLLIRLCFAICSSRDYLFSQEEKEKLEATLNLSSNELIDILLVMKDILFQATQNTLQPALLQEMLITSGMQESHAIIFSDQWTKNGKMIVGVMKKTSLAKWQMRGLTWEFHGEVASTNTARQKVPIALMNFSLGEAPLPLQVHATEKDDLSKSKEILVQMDQKDLLAFYNELEKIQQQIDALKH